MVKNTLTFGKHKGRNIQSVPLAYLCWLLENCLSMDAGLKRRIQLEVAQRLDLRRELRGIS